MTVFTVRDGMLVLMMLICCVHLSFQQTTTDCTFSWTTKNGTNAPGLIQFGSANQYTEDTCKTECEKKATCLSADYNTLDKTCFHGTAANPATVTNQFVKHFDLVRNCGGGCTFSWTRKVGVNAPGLTIRGTANQFTEDTCKTECEKTTTCLSIDYNTLDKTCFFGTTQNPATVTNQFVNHLDLVRTCNNASATSSDCMTTWTEYDSLHSLNGVQMIEINETYLCLKACQWSHSCVGVDIDLNFPIRCWLHFNAKDFQQVFSSNERTQFRVNRCPTSGPYLCNPTFTPSKTDTISRGGTVLAGVSTLPSCQYACQDAAPSCQGIDFYPNSTCVLHGADTLGRNLQTLSGATQYNLADICSTVCYPKWTKFDNTMGAGGTAVSVANSYNNITACLEYCLRTRDCSGIDFTNGATTPCSYYKYNQIDRLIQRQTKVGTVQYQLDNICDNQCTTTYAPNDNTKAYIVGSREVAASNPSECQQRCNIEATCLVYLYTKGNPFICTLGTDWVDGTLVTNTNYVMVMFRDDVCSKALPSSPAPTGQPNANCGGTFALTAGRNVPGLAIQGSANSFNEETCKTACSNSATCTGIDWNNQDKTCFFGTTTNPSTVANAVVNHWELTRNSNCGVSGSGGMPGTGMSQITTTSGTCTNNWVLTSGRNVPGLSQRTGTFTENSCKDACVANATCKNIDFNNLDKTCFFGTTANPSTIPNAQVNHWELTRCGGVTSACKFELTFTAGMNSPGLTMIGTANQHAEVTCIGLCELNPSCWSVDYNTLDKTCFHGFTANPPKVQNAAVNHYDAIRTNCAGASSVAPSG